MIAGFNRRYATGNFSYAMPALKRRPTLKPSLRDEEQARLASKIQRAKMWVMTRFPTCPTDDSRGESSVRMCRTGWEPVLHIPSEKYLTDALAVDQLQKTDRYESAAEFWPQYLRGQAYLN